MFHDHPKARRRLADEPIIWMTTVTAGGQPQTSPVWFILDGDEVLVYSARSRRLANIAANPQVALNLDGDGRGGAIVTFEGTARVVPDEAPASANGAYLAKYATFMARNGWTPERFSELYPVAVRVRFARGRAW
jgi:PPOX class probable F420-dependent enzyme